MQACMHMKKTGMHSLVEAWTLSIVRKEYTMSMEAEQKAANWTVMLGKSL